ncbi:MAG TPA: hypothetical protein PK156_42095, partial [Polyangium sp.]|nr:hypothetical protein [Polyangium sp.]
AVPDDLSDESSCAWACDEAAAFHDRACPQLRPEIIKAEIEQRRALWSTVAASSVDEVLVCFPGKDLLAALMKTNWFLDKELQNAGMVCAALRDWIVAHPEEALEYLPEWQRFKEILNGL